MCAGALPGYVSFLGGALCVGQMIIDEEISQVFFVIALSC